MALFKCPLTKQSNTKIPHDPIYASQAAAPHLRHHLLIGLIKWESFENGEAAYRV